MTQESEKGHRSWWWALPGAIGLALVMTAIMLWAPNGPTAYCAACETPDGTSTPCTSTPTATATRTPTVTATPNEDCILDVSKSDSPDPVGEGGQITYTITIKNEGDGNGDCTDLLVTDDNPTNTTCVSASVDASSDISEDDFDINECEDWTTETDLDTGDQVVLKMVVKLTSGADEDETITNEACATSSDDVGGDCGSARTTVGKAATATPTTAPTATTRPTVQPVAPPPVAPPPIAPPPTALIAPMTGSGADGGSGTAQTLALALGLLGAGLLLVTGVAFAKRTR